MTPETAETLRLVLHNQSHPLTLACQYKGPRILLIGLQPVLVVVMQLSLANKDVAADLTASGVQNTQFPDLGKLMLPS